MRCHVPCVAVALLTISLVFTNTAQADTTYTYTGNNFDTITGPTYNTSMSVSGNFTLSAPLPRNLPMTDIRNWELSYSFTDDVQVRTDSDSYLTVFEVATDANGQISDWRIHIVALPVATMVGDVRTLVETHSGQVEEVDRGGEAHCTEVTLGVCSSFSMDDWGEVSGDPGSWMRTGDVPPTLATYSYEGNDFVLFEGPSYSPGDHVEATFALATPLAPNLPLTDVSDALISFTIFDGVHTRTLTDSYVPSFEVATDGSGAINEWSIFVVEGPPATAIGDIRHSINTLQTPSVVVDSGGVGTCSDIVYGICVTFSLTDYGRVFDDSGDWDRPPTSPATADHTYVGNNYTYIEGTSYDLSMFLSGTFSTAEPLPRSMAMADITHTVTSFDFFDGVETRTMDDSWGWRFRVETDADGDISRWNINLQEEPEATSLGERRHRADTFSFWVQGLGLYSTDQAGYGDCTDVINGTCTTFVLDDFGTIQFEPATWNTTVTSTTNPIPSLSVWGATFLVFVLAALGVIRLWRM